MAGDTNVVNIFECDGNFSFLHQTHRFTFKIYSDNSLRVDIELIVFPDQFNSRDPTIGFDQETTISEEFDDYDDNVDAMTIASIPIDDMARIEFERAQIEAEDDIMTTLSAFDGRALIELPMKGPQDPMSSLSYMVHFKIIQWNRSSQRVWSQIIKCVGRLSRDQGMSGWFLDVSESMDEAQDFRLKPVDYRVEIIKNPLYPLTPGHYEMQGITIAENAFVYECAVSLTLQANGMVSGTSRELPFAQECPLTGMWSRSHLKYLLQYKMLGNRHAYIYCGIPFSSSLQGTWQNSELLVLKDLLDEVSIQAERGVVELQLIQAVRVWSEGYHKDYPTTFKECVKLLLLASCRNSILPNHLWSSVIVYCGYDWFSPS
ncbi:hypothetical protein CCR75_005931 [Bremia lactucae]|uniref:Uncharacterized protein n=1 Tax=Bremia lactucae TaxID=4779 RepID=A0A976NZQ4_BRELC|nr:hypothetical protein CCR75_005931 [Bremia lactucae]